MRPSAVIAVVQAVVGQSLTGDQHARLLGLLGSGPPVRTNGRRTTSDAQLRSIVEGGVAFETGQPVTFTYIRNTESAPKRTAQDFGQAIEPAGRYMLHDTARSPNLPSTWERGTIAFQSPIVLWHGNTTSQPDGWKARLSAAFGGKRGAALSRAIVAAGHDGIVTVDTHGTSEIVDLTNPIRTNDRRRNPESGYGQGHMPTEDGNPAHNLTRDMPADILTHPHYYTGFRQYLTSFWSSIQAAQGNPSAPIVIYRALPAERAGFSPGDWVTPSFEYAQRHATSNLGGRPGHVVAAIVAARDVRFAGDDLIEWGYFGPPVQGRAVTRPIRPNHFARTVGTRNEFSRITPEMLQADPELAENVFDLLTTSYAAIGGHAKIRSVQDLYSPRLIIYGNDLDTDPHADAISIYKHEPAGYKSVASATDGGPDAKAAVVQRSVRNFNTPGYFGEVSGAIAHILLTRHQVPVVTDQHTVEAALETPVRWLGFHPDGKYPGVYGWYARRIGDHEHVKIMLGMPKNGLRSNPVESADALEHRLQRQYGVKLSLSQTRRGLVLNMIKVPADRRGQGTGDAVLSELTAYADAHGLPMELTPEVPDGERGSNAKLERWYARHGFVANRGRNRDYETTAGMIRRPRT